MARVLTLRAHRTGVNLSGALSPAPFRGARLLWRILLILVVVVVVVGVILPLSHIYILDVVLALLDVLDDSLVVRGRWRNLSCDGRGRNCGREHGLRHGPIHNPAAKAMDICCRSTDLVL